MTATCYMGHDQRDMVLMLRIHILYTSHVKFLDSNRSILCIFVSVPRLGFASNPQGDHGDLWSHPAEVRRHRHLLPSGGACSPGAGRHTYDRRQCQERAVDVLLRCPGGEEGDTFKVSETGRDGRQRVCRGGDAEWSLLVTLALRQLAFLDQVLEEMPFAIQRVQTDRGAEFFAEEVQRRLMGEAIRFRPIPPRSPHLNGKVERAQRTILEKFWAVVDPKAADVGEQLALWIHHYNWHRSHESLHGEKPVDRVCQRADKTPLRAAVCEGSASRSAIMPLRQCYGR
jgi:hypothetical protein